MAALTPQSSKIRLGRDDRQRGFGGILEHRRRAGVEARWGATILGAIAVLCVAPSGRAQTEYTNTAPIVIDDFPAPAVESSVTVDQPAGRVITKVEVGLHNVTHPRPRDLQILLVAPTGKRLLLQSNAGGAADWTNESYTLSDDAAAYLVCNGLPATARPTDCSFPNAALGAPAPDPPYITPGPGMDTNGNGPPGSLSAFVGDPPSGTWRLYARDGGLGDEGMIFGGWTLTLWTSSHQFSNRAPIAIPDAGSFIASTVSVSGLHGVIDGVSVTLFGLEHTQPDDLDVFLESPTGMSMVLQSDAGGSTDAQGLTYTLSAPGPPMPDAQPQTLGDLATWRPTNHGPSSVGEFPAGMYDPGPVPMSGSLPGSLSVFNGGYPNGEWVLRVRDDSPGDIGALSGGWALDVQTTRPSHVKGDFTDDHQADLILRNDANQYSLWQMNESARVWDESLPPLPASERVVGAADFDGDGSTDLVLYDTNTREVSFALEFVFAALSIGGGPVPLTGAPILGQDWKLAATADFNNDANPDLVWRNVTSQKIVIWTLNRTNKVGVITPTPDAALHANWEIVAALDFDVNATTDFLWYNTSSGKIVIWNMDANVVRTAGDFTNPSSAGNNNWRVVAAGDYGVGADGPDAASPATGRQDLVWRNETSGKLVLWHMNGGGQRTNGTFLTPDAPEDALSWHVVGPR